MCEDKMLEFTKDIAKEIAKDVYSDAGKPIAKPTGELIGLVPRAIKAALSPLEKWIMQKEYNIAETQKLLELKLQNVPPELIEVPEPYIAVPILQYISYCMDCNELRDMYANLLANSMNKVVKNGVHPGFVEIIKQLSPDEAKLLKYMMYDTIVPTITLRYENDMGDGIIVIKDFSNVGETAGCEQPAKIAEYFDNLIRLGLLTKASDFAALTDKTVYEPLKKHELILPYVKEDAVNQAGFSKIKFIESFISVSSYGSSFGKICLTAESNN